MSRIPPGQRNGLNSPVEFSEGACKGKRFPAYFSPALIGGIVVRVGSQSFDGSIRSQLKDIQNQLLEEVPS